MILKRAQDQINITFDWSGSLPTGVTVSSVTHDPPAGLTLVNEATNTPNSTAKISGGSHGHAYSLQGTATLSNGEVVVDYVTILVSNDS